MYVKQIRDRLKEVSEESGEEIIILENESYDNSIIGLTTDYRLVYSYEKMIEELAAEYIEADTNPNREYDSEEDAYEAAQEWIDYNTIRSLPYMGEKAPIIIYEDMLK